MKRFLARVAGRATSQRAVGNVAAAVLLASVLSAFTPHTDAFVWPNVPDRIARALESNDASERRVAAHQIRDLPAELAGPLVQKALEDEDDQVRIEAAAAAVQFKTKGVGDIVIPWLSENDSKLRLAACDVILVSPSPRAVQALGRVLGDQSPQVRVAAAHAMGASGASDAVSPLLGHLDDSSPEVRGEVATALGHLGDSRAVLPLVSKVRDSSPEVRRRVARALGALGDTRAVSALVLAQSDANFEVRLEGIRALGILGSDEATAALTSVVTGDAASANESAKPEADAAMRRAALESLGRIGSARAITVLINALDGDLVDALTGNGAPAHDALVSVGTAAIKPLIAHIEGNPSVGGASGAVLALGDLRATDAVDAIVKGMQREVIPIVPGLRALGKLRDARALPEALELIGNNDAKVREATIAAAEGMLDPAAPDGRAVEPIQSALASATDVDERVGLIGLLGRTGAPRVAPTLIELSKNNTIAIRRAALRALGLLSASSKDIDAALLKAMDDEQAPVRADAALALSRVGSSEIAPEILRRLVEAAEQDRQALGLALSGVLARTTDDAVIKSAADAVTSAPDSYRDALIEGIGRSPAPGALGALEAISKGAGEDRRKVAEGLGAQPKSEPLLLALIKDADPSVRAAAAWSLGKVGSAAAVSPLAELLNDLDVDVAMNAAAALGRLGARVGASATAPMKEPLCKALDDPRSYVRANAVLSLGAMATAGGAALLCDITHLHSMLLQDSSEVVRETVARTLRALPAAAADAGTKPALAHCASEDANATVADACDRAPLFVANSKRTYGLAIYVAGDSKGAPTPSAPFTLILPNGPLRAGLADRRGIVFENEIVDGPVELGVPAALAP